jgi:putative transposase
MISFVMRFFDPDDQLQITQRKLPHWSQDGVVCFITWRTHDSMPKAVVEKWLAERGSWLEQRGIDVRERDWKRQLYQLDPAVIAEFHDHFTSRWHEELDRCHGACVLRDTKMSGLVAESLMHFDGDRYEMLDFVIMPNHVHFLAVFPDKDILLKQCESWKRYTARMIQDRLGSEGRFWQQDAFDHLVRHETEFKRLQCYITENPVRARLKPGEFYLRQYSTHLSPRDEFGGRER